MVHARLFEQQVTNLTMIGVKTSTRNEMEQVQTPAKSVQRTISDWTAESNTGWESGDDSSLTDLDLTDHSMDTNNDRNSLCFANSSNTKLKNPWKKPNEIKRTDTSSKAQNVTTVPKKSPSTTSENESDKIKKVTNSCKVIPRMVKTASMRGKAMVRNAGRGLVRSASKRFSQASRERIVLKPTLKDEKSQIRNKADPEKQDSKVTDETERARSADLAMNTKVVPTKTYDGARSADPPPHRKTPQKVPSYLQQLWQKQSKANTKMLLQWAVWEVQVDQLSKPPSLQPWVSINPNKSGATTNMLPKEIAFP